MIDEIQTQWILAWPNHRRGASGISGRKTHEKHRDRQCSGQCVTLVGVMSVT